jgi:tetratricopeptide (TPR) repeat protein
MILMALHIEEGRHVSADRILATKGLVLGAVTAALALGLVFSGQPLLLRWHHYRAGQFLRAGQNQRAFEELQRALWLVPDGAEAHLLLAKTLRREGELEAVHALLRRAQVLGSDPDRVQRETWLLWAQSGRLEEAEPHLASLLMDPGDDGPDICHAYVLGYFAGFRFQQASELLDAWEKQYPQDAQPYFMRGYLMAALQRKRDSAAAYRQGLEIAPHETAMRCRLADVLIETHELDEAGEHLRQCLEEDPQDPDILLSWATWLFARGDAEQACAVLEQLLGIAPGQFEGQRLLGEVELSRGRYREALRCLEPAAKQRPYDRKCRYLLGRALVALGRDVEAKPHLDYSSEAGRAILRMEDQVPTLVSRPDDAQLRYEIGTTLLKYGSPDDGVKWLQTVLRLQPDHPGAHQALAAYYEARGDRQRALPHRQHRRRE